MKNVTITVEDATLEWVRIEAAKRNTSVSRLVGEMLTRIYHEGRGAPQYHANDYGAGTNLPAARALFMGSQAALIAFGSPGTGQRAVRGRAGQSAIGRRLRHRGR